MCNVDESMLFGNKLVSNAHVNSYGLVTNLCQVEFPRVLRSENSETSPCRRTCRLWHNPFSPL